MARDAVDLRGGQGPEGYARDMYDPMRESAPRPNY
jgi:hypothetical protein